MTGSKGTEARLHGVALKCAMPECTSQLSLPGGTADQFFEAFESAHFDGWLCLVNTPFEVLCPSCNGKQPRSLQSHQVLREKLAGQSEWKRDVALAVWAAMPGVDDEYLRETEMPIAMKALLGNEKTAGSAHVRQALEQIERTFSRGRGPNAAEASRLARLALAR